VSAHSRPWERGDVFRADASTGRAWDEPAVVRNGSGGADRPMRTMTAQRAGDISHDRRGGPIDLVLPSDASLMRVARLVASGVATFAGFDFDELEDLRIAVDELCAALIEGGTGSPIALRFDVLGDRVDVDGTTGVDGAAYFEPERYGLSRQILAAVVDTYSIDHSEDQLHVQLCKRGAGTRDDGRTRRPG
jgi:serine/threonine-protein kinase RsbW